jgi:hypothetical protein
MPHADALRVALDLFHVPSRVRFARADPLPEDVLFLLRIAAGDDRAVKQAVQASHRSAAVVREAATFFIEQVLLCPESDSYRVLGVSPEATASELRRNMALLVKWLHPDTVSKGQPSVFLNRVTLAWDDLKNAERRAAYDRKPRRARPQKKLVRLPRRRSQGQPPKSSPHRSRGAAGQHGLLRMLLAALRGARHSGP